MTVGRFFIVTMITQLNVAIMHVQKLRVYDLVGFLMEMCLFLKKYSAKLYKIWQEISSEVSEWC